MILKGHGVRYQLHSIVETSVMFNVEMIAVGTVEDFRGFVVVLTGDIMTMPGLPKVPAAERIDVDEFGKISGLF